MLASRCTFANVPLFFSGNDLVVHWGSQLYHNLNTFCTHFLAGFLTAMSEILCVDTCQCIEVHATCVPAHTTFVPLSTRWLDINLALDTQCLYRLLKKKYVMIFTPEMLTHDYWKQTLILSELNLVWWLMLSELYILIPVLVILTFIDSHMVTRKTESLSSYCGEVLKWYRCNLSTVTTFEFVEMYSCLDSQQFSRETTLVQLKKRAGGEGEGGVGAGGLLAFSPMFLTDFGQNCYGDVYHYTQKSGTSFNNLYHHSSS